MRFAISVPVGSYHPFLETCLRSLAAQSEETAVALLDASNDPRVVEVADRYNGLFAHRFHGPDNGQADAIANGWDQSDGDVLGWLNADDFLYPDALAKARTALEDNDVVYGHSTIINMDKSITGWQYGVEQPSSRLSHASVISQPSCFFKRGAHDAIGGINRDLHYTMDWDLFVRLYNSGASFHFIDEALSQVLWSDETKTASLNKRRRQEINRMVKLRPGEKNSVKTFLGFATQYVIDSAPPKLKQHLLSSMMSSRSKFFGIGADGSMGPIVTIPFCHFEQSLRTHAVLTFDILPELSSASAGGTPCACAVDERQKQIEVSFAEPLGPAQRLELSLELAPGGSGVFRSAALS